MMNGFGCNLSNLSRLSEAKSRSISAENPDGSKGGGARATTGTGASCASELGCGWKVSPSVVIPAGTTFTIAEIEGSGAIQHIWMTPAVIQGRQLTIRFYWDYSEIPSVECPLGDFFANAFVSDYYPVSSLAVCVNPKNGFNCYWEMPFRQHCRVTVENLSDHDTTLYYQIDYILSNVPEDCAYFHAQYRRSNPLPYKSVHTIVDGITGKGQYVGTYMVWGSHNSGWWGEGEIKFFLDDDLEFPTICGTGTEDYFCGAYNFDVNGAYTAFSTPYSGMTPILPDGLYRSQTRFSMYRWHIPDPIRFENHLKVTIQALGWRSNRKYLPLQDDISSVAFWYQTLPAPTFPAYPTVGELEIN